MATVANSQDTSLDSRKRHGRAVNAVAELLRRKIAVPHIYLKPTAKLLHPDVLAVDRAGSGDLHAVEIKLETGVSGRHPKKPTDLRDWNQINKDGHSVDLPGVVKKFHDQLRSSPANYRYVAIPAETCTSLVPILVDIGLYSPDGIGRLGVISIRDKGEDRPEAEIVLARERFRVEPGKMIAIEKFLEKAKPDIEVRI
jgi:hypothetical protein